MGRPRVRFDLPNMSKQQNIRIRHEQNGWCIRHVNVPRMKNRKVCEKCFNADNERRQRRYNSGVCPNHPNETLILNRKKCQKCIEVGLKRTNKRKSDGVCTNHPDKELSKGSVVCCDECVLKNRFDRIARTLRLSKVSYEREFQKRGGRCDLCEKSCQSISNLDPSITLSQKIHVDHCHKTNKLRGFLCLQCNTLLGQFDENKNRLKTLLNRLDKYLSDQNPGIEPDCK